MNRGAEPGPGERSSTAVELGEDDGLAVSATGEAVAAGDSGDCANGSAGCASDGASVGARGGSDAGSAGCAWAPTAVNVIAAP